MTSLKQNKFIAAIFTFVLFTFTINSLLAQPSVKISGNRVTIQEGVTNEIIAEINKSGAKEIAFTLQKFNSNDDLAKICKTYPNMKELEISAGEQLTSIAPVAQLTTLTRFRLSGNSVTDFSPLSGLTGLTSLSIESSSVQNLKWMSKLTKLTSLRIEGNNFMSGGTKFVSLEGIPSLPELTKATFSSAKPESLEPLKALSGLKELELRNVVIKDLTPLKQLAKLGKLSLYGSTVKDFSPLAECPALKELEYYATEDADYSTLGKLTKIEILDGGLTKLNNISWTTSLPNLRKLQVFAEYIADYSPLAKTKLEDLTIWSMRTPPDLKQLSGAVSLKRLKLWSTKIAGGFEGLASLLNLEELILDGMNAKDGAAVDMAFVKKLVNLKKLTLNNAEITGNFNDLANCAKLESVQIDSRTKGIANLDALKKLPNLTSLQVPKGMFTEAQLQGFANPKINIRER
ncbi:MAG: hypothetical protein LBC84_10485 [Prevotellaceae bacterium]|jgi:internalin A|nr:hypothetical protein [Prevotellaceae bacterium]